MPAKRVQTGISLRLTAPRRFLTPFLIAGLKTEIIEIIIESRIILNSILELDILLPNFFFIYGQYGQTLI
jgi:hypothetical protein